MSILLKQMAQKRKQFRTWGETDKQNIPAGELSSTKHLGTWGKLLRVFKH